MSKSITRLLTLILLACAATVSIAAQEKLAFKTDEVISFEQDKTSVELKGEANSDGFYVYQIRAEKGQTINVAAVFRDNASPAKDNTASVFRDNFKPVFEIRRLNETGDDAPLIKGFKSRASLWKGEIEESGEYLIVVSASKGARAENKLLVWNLRVTLE